VVYQLQPLQYAWPIVIDSWAPLDIISALIAEEEGRKSNARLVRIRGIEGEGRNARLDNLYVLYAS